MNKRDKKNNIFISKSFGFFIVIFFVTIFLGIGYAQISDIDLTVSGTAMAQRQTGVVISEIDYLSDFKANVSESKINTYYQTMLDSKVSLENDVNSSITYRMTIQNLTDVEKKFSGVVYDNYFYDNPNITFELENLAVGDILNSGESITFNITFKYLGSDTSKNVLNSYLNFKYEDIVLKHSIIYDTNIDTSGKSYPTTVDDHGNISFSFQGEKPSKVYVNGEIWNGYFPTTGRLVIDDVTKDLLISCEYDTIGKAEFTNSSSLNNVMKSLAGGDSNIKAIKYSDVVPSNAVQQEVASSNSTESIYMWFDNGVIYWNSIVKNPLLSGNYDRLFAGFSNLENIDGLLTWDTQGLTSISEMFKDNASLVSVEALKYWDLSQVKDLSGLFQDCLNLIDISALRNWDVSNSENFSNMFYNDKSISSESSSQIDGWDLRPTANFNNMFYNVVNKPTFKFNIDGGLAPGTWESNGTLIVPSANKNKEK